MRVAGKLRGGLRLLRLIGPHPLVLAAEVRHRAGRATRRRRLRRSFDALIGTVPPGATIRLQPLDVPSLDAAPDDTVPALEEVLLDADRILRHEMRFLSAEWHSYGEVIDWSRDPITGYRWPLGLHFDLPVRDLTTSDDPKRVWELSRGHQLLTLARAARLRPERSERYVAELEAQLVSWIDANPVGHSVNWAVAMEVGIRATNWIVALRTLGGLDRLSPATQRAVTESLQQHGRFIVHHLEGSPRMRSNHYVGNLLGLALLGTSIDGDPDARRWRALARREVPRQILAQTHPDGGNFEASVAYHGLVLEMFSIAVNALEQDGWRLPPAARERLAAMLTFSRGVRHPDGRVPQFGDNDSGRVLPSTFDRPLSHDATLWLAAAALRLPPPLPGVPDAEALLAFGSAAWLRLQDEQGRAGPPTTAFPQSGVYVLSGGGSHMVVDCGDVGQAGNGGHAHHDVLAFEWSLDGAPVIVDPGTFSYTGDPAARNRYRSTRSHATWQIDDDEIEQDDPQRLFQLGGRSRPRVESYGGDPTSVRLVAVHSGFSPSDEYTVRRSLRLDRESGAVSILDAIDGPGTHRVRLTLPLAPGWTADVHDDRIRLAGPGPAVEIVTDGTHRVLVEDSHVSDGYGIEVPSLRIVLERLAPLPLNTTTIVRRAA